MPHVLGRAHGILTADDGAPGEVAVFSRVEGSLVLEQRGSSGGREPAHLAVDPSGRFLVVANYGGRRVAVHVLPHDGLVDRPSHVVPHSGASVHPVRQKSAHPHQVHFDPQTSALLVTDVRLGTIVHARCLGSVD
ncbi:MAG: lactonase family protein [Allorhizobium sp.]